MPHLPPEVIDEVIDYLAGDKKTLCSCSLASRAFSPRTRLHLFRTMSILPDNSERLLDAVQGSPDLIKFIKNVCITNNPLEVKEAGTRKWCLEWLSQQTRLPNFLSSLERVESLDFDLGVLMEETSPVPWADLPPPLLVSTTQIIHSQSLTTLCLTGFTFSDFNDLHIMLLQCQKLCSLGLYELTFTTISSVDECLAASEKQIVRPTLKELGIMGWSRRDGRAFITYFSDPRCPLDVQKLSDLVLQKSQVKPDWDHYHEFIRALLNLQSNPTTLKYLDIFDPFLVGRGWLSEDAARRIFKHSGLKSLNIGVFNGGHIVRDDEAGFLPFIMLWPEDHPISSLTIAVRFYREWDGDLSNWKIIDKTLSSLPNLSKMSIEIHTYSNVIRDIQSLFRRVFSNLLGRQGFKELNFTINGRFRSFKA